MKSDEIVVAPEKMGEERDIARKEDQIPGEGKRDQEDR